MCHQSGVEETVHTYSLTYVQSIICFIRQDLVPTSPLGKLHPKPTAVLIVTMVSIRTHSVLTTQFLQVIGFRGFILFSVSLIPLHLHRIWYFPVMVSRRGGWGEGLGGCMFLKKGGTSRRGDEKRNGGWLIHPSVL